MSYLSQSLLANDAEFVGRCRAALTNQSAIFINDERQDISALAEGLLRLESEPLLSFFPMIAAAPGFADKVDKGDGTIDQSQVSDGELLSAVQAEYPTVAALFFDADGTPKGA